MVDGVFLGEERTGERERMEMRRCGEIEMGTVIVEVFFDGEENGRGMEV